MRLPAVTLAGLAFLEVDSQHADPEAKGLLGVIGRKLHQGDRMPRHGVKAHTHRVVALDHRRPDPAVRVCSGGTRWPPAPPPHQAHPGLVSPPRRQRHVHLDRRLSGHTWTYQPDSIAEPAPKRPLDDPPEPPPF